jgi:ADP-ribose pyrophosphatase
MDRCVPAHIEASFDYYYWEGGDFAQVFALTDSGEILLVTQYKHGVKEIVTELPAGMISQGELPIDAARRELLEETGFGGGDWIPLGVLHVSSAKATTRAFPFLARGVSRIASPSPDQNELIDVTAVEVEVLLRLISDGRINDSNSIAASLRALRYLGPST